MEIIIGKTPGVKFKKKPELPLKKETDLPVRILHSRPARSRKKTDWQGNNRRNTQQGVDPVNARVLLLLVPDGNSLPADIIKGNYQLRLRIIPAKDQTAKSNPEISSEKGFSRRV